MKSGVIQANEKFPDMKGAGRLRPQQGAEDRHLFFARPARPARGYEGSLGHEEQDAQTYAAWGFDYLKYD